MLANIFIYIYVLVLASWCNIIHVCLVEVGKDGKYSIDNPEGGIGCQPQFYWASIY